MLRDELQTRNGVVDTNQALKLPSSRFHWKYWIFIYSWLDRHSCVHDSSTTISSTMTFIISLETMTFQKKCFLVTKWMVVVEASLNTVLHIRKSFKFAYNSEAGKVRVHDLMSLIYNFMVILINFHSFYSLHNE